MSSVDYSEQNAISSINVPQAVTIPGNGGLGAWAGYFCALAGVKKFTLFDPGTVKPTDLARLPYSNQFLNKPKVEALSNLIKSARPEVEIISYNRPYNCGPDDNLISGTLIQGAPSKAVEDYLYNYCLSNGIPYFSGGYTALKSATFSTLPDSLSLTEESIPNWVGSKEALENPA